MRVWKRWLITTAALALCLTACAPKAAPDPTMTPAPEVTSAPTETSAPTSTPGPTPASPAAYSGPVTDALETLLDSDRWSARFWIFPGTGPLGVELPEAEYGDALRELFAAYDWKELTYEETRHGEDFKYPSDAYSFQILAGYPPRDDAGPQILGVSNYDPHLQMGIKKEDGSYGSRYFTAEGAETLCADIADLWPGWEALTGCRTRILPQATKEDTARAYLEATFDKLRGNGHITDARIDSLEVSSWTYDNDLGEMVESGDMDYDSSKSVLFRTVFSLKPTRPELTYWQERGVDKEGWAHFELGRVSLSQWGDDELCELDWFEYSRTAPRKAR